MEGTELGTWLQVQGVRHEQCLAIPTSIVLGTRPLVKTLPLIALLYAYA